MSRKKVKELRDKLREQEQVIRELEDRVKQLELQRDYVVRKLLRLERN